MATEREGGEARQGANSHRQRVKELENQNGERESLPSDWDSRKKVRAPQTPTSPQEQQKKSRGERRRQKMSV